MEEPMNIKESKTGKGIRFSISGSLSGTEKSTLHLFEKVSVAMGKKPKEIVMDLKKITFMDSLSIGLLIGILLKCKENGIQFRLENIDEELKKIFKMTNLTKIFPELY